MRRYPTVKCLSSKTVITENGKQWDDSLLISYWLARILSKPYSEKVGKSACSFWNVFTLFLTNSTSKNSQKHFEGMTWLVLCACLSVDRLALIRKIQGNEDQIVLKEDFKRSYHIISNALIVTHERDEGARLLLAALHLVNQLNPVNTDTEGGGGVGAA